MSSAPPSDRRRLRRAAVAVDAAAVGVGRDADDIPERFGELAAVIIPKLAGNIQHRAVGLPQEQALLGKDITTIKRGTGCTHCNGTGYRGRIAVHEIVTIDRNIRRMISRGAETEEIEAYAREQQGMRSLKEKGLELVKQGVTTPEELLRIAYYA